MTLLDLEGFDWVNGFASQFNRLSPQWTTTVNPGTNVGRFGDGFSCAVFDEPCVTCTLATPLATGTAVIVGGAWNSNGGGNANQLGLYDSTGPEHVRIKRELSGKLAAYRGPTTTLLGTGTKYIVPGVWYYIEHKIVVHDSTGSIEIRVNGITDLTLTGIDTRNGGNGDISAISFGSSIVSLIDDVYICDDSGADHNDFLGEMRVGTIRPDGAGNSTQWTPSAGSNYQNVDEQSANDDTDYNSSSTAGDKDLYTLGALPSTPTTIIGVKTVLQHRKDDAGSRVIRHLLRTNSTDYEGSDVSVTDSWQATQRVFDKNPNTSANFTPTEITNLEAGIKLQS